jgi:hypothetical protein
MSARNDGGPAYPVPGLQNDPDFNGMSLRDYFAAQAMQAAIGLIPHMQPPTSGKTVPDCLTAMAYEYADAMLKAREA